MGVKYGCTGKGRACTCGHRIPSTTTSDAFCEAKQPEAVRCIDVPMEECQNLLVLVSTKTGRKLKPRFVDV